MSTALPIPKFKTVKQQYTLHNAKPEAVTARWASRSFTIPAVDELGVAPAAYPNGQPIPGTLVLMDGYTLNADGHVPEGGPPNWLASEAIRNILGIDPETGEAIGDYAKGGISFLPESPTPETVAAVRADGERRYKISLRSWARETVAAYEVAHEKAKLAGVEAKPYGKDYAQAVSLLRQEDEENRGVVPGVVDLASVVSDDDEIEFAVFAKARALELANKAGANLTVNREALAEELLKDQNILDHLRKKFRIEEISKPKPAGLPRAAKP